MMAELDLWIEGDWGDDHNTINWHRSKVPFDLPRFQHDERYAQLVNAHVKRALEYLGKELADISRAVPWPEDEQKPPCE